MKIESKWRGHPLPSRPYGSEEEIEIKKEAAY